MPDNQQPLVGLLSVRYQAASRSVVIFADGMFPVVVKSKFLDSAMMSCF